MQYEAMIRNQLEAENKKKLEALKVELEKQRDDKIDMIISKLQEEMKNKQSIFNDQ